MRRESLRRHGVLDKVEGTGGVALFKEARREAKAESEMMEKKREWPEEAGSARTETEVGLEGYKGRGNAVRRFKEQEEKVGVE